MARKSHSQRYYAFPATPGMSRPGRNFARTFKAWGPVTEYPPYEDLSDAANPPVLPADTLRESKVSRCKGCGYAITMPSTHVPAGYHRFCYGRR